MRNKMIFGLGQFPFTLMGIAHGHGDEIYVQYSNELWPNDPNSNIRSLLRLFHTLEIASIAESRLLLEEPPKNSFFACLLQGKLHCVCELCTPEKIVSVELLPKNLLPQMDNYLKDNKNQHLLAFLSLLTIKDVFEKVKLGFLVVSPTQ